MTFPYLDLDPLTQMNPDWQHCREDNELNLAKQPAVRKIGMLLNVMSQLKKVRLQIIVAICDQCSGSWIRCFFWPRGSGMGIKTRFGSGIWIRDEDLGSYFRVLRNNFLGYKKYLNSLMRIRNLCDPGSGMEKIRIRIRNTICDHSRRCSSICNVRFLNKKVFSYFDYFHT